MQMRNPASSQAGYMPMEGLIPPVGPEGIGYWIPAVMQEASKRQSHLLFHSDKDGMYLPIESMKVPILSSGPDLPVLGTRCLLSPPDSFSEELRESSDGRTLPENIIVSQLLGRCLVQNLWTVGADESWSTHDFMLTALLLLQGTLSGAAAAFWTSSSILQAV
jgi:hypothetical protein